MAELAAALERADRAEVQLRTATDESLRLAARVERLELELADARCDLAKSREETIAVTSLATTHGARAGELEREALGLREKSYQLELDVATMAAERDRLACELAAAHTTLTDMSAARAQLANQLEEVVKQHSRTSAAAAAADDRHKAEVQQLQVRLATAEAECRALHHGKGTMYEDLQRARTDILSLQAQLQEESRRREEQASEHRRLQKELEVVTESFAQAQRSQRSAATVSEDLQEELDRLRTAHSGLAAELQVANERMQRLQDESRTVAERNAELTGQLNGMSAALRQLEVENARLADGHAALRVEIEARAAEARAARGEAAELAADRARLLAELQKTAAPNDEAEASSLRVALTASRLEVARLQKELAANDAVLADAESALVALVSEKEGLQQALSVALMSERIAMDTAEELKSQVSALTGQGSVPGEAVDKAAAHRKAPGTSEDGKGVDQRMISYLQSLHDDGSAVRRSESGHEQSSTAMPGAASIGPHSVASSMAAPPSVRIVGPPVPVRAALRYPSQHPLSASESGSTLAAYRPGANMDSWEALSASGTDNSANQTGSGEGVAAVPPAGLSSASLVVSSFAFGVPSHEVVAVAGKDAGLTSSAGSAGTGAIRTSSGGDTDAARRNSEAHGTLFSLSRAASSARSGVRITDQATGMADIKETMVAEVTAIPTTFVPAAGGGSGPSALTVSNSGTQAATNASIVASNVDGQCIRSSADTAAQGLTHMDKGPRAHVFMTTVSDATPGVALANFHTPTSISTILNRQLAGGSSLQAAINTSPLEVFRSSRTPSSNFAVQQSLQNLSTAAESPPISSAQANASAGLAGASPSQNLDQNVAATTVLRQHDLLSSALAGRHAPLGQVGTTLQSVVYRSPMRASLVTPRIGLTGGALGANGPDGHEPGTASRPASVGGTGAGSTSPMISPRVMLDARMLSRAVRPSTEALSTPLRRTNVAPGGASPEDQGPAGSSQAQYSDYTVRRASRMQAPTSSHLQSLASGLQHPAPPLHSYPIVPAASSTLQPEVSAFPSPFASGNAAAAVASPRTSGTMGAVAPFQPPSSSVHSLERTPKRFTIEQHQPSSSSTTPVRTSVTLSFARRSTLTPEGGLAVKEATSVNKAANDGHSYAANGMSASPPTGNVLASSGLLVQAPSEEDAMLLKRLAAMDDALRAIGAM